ncbi:MAG: hypothetical protein A3I05_02800 [Deltaproteobacteria bacterium RIFCSPLOWO2_02_FULL_44_10]|nr:MAG: hypothetical protein A3C46_03465 [Deltaproteobacteria bacterium RIFCSPHIGHO2_02_FULL_44_16]OGQ46544.1 MAG: hypothetical protein A3I05_02800 [Deltaproteobacteria bacterium RIFCSPLOWO2_02_FULL_44_10]
MVDIVIRQFASMLDVLDKAPDGVNGKRRPGQSDGYLSRSDLTQYTGVEGISLKNAETFQQKFPSAPAGTFSALRTYESFFGDGDRKLSLDEAFQFNDEFSPPLKIVLHMIGKVREVDRLSRGITAQNKFDIRDDIIAALNGLVSYRSKLPIKVDYLTRIDKAKRPNDANAEAQKGKNDGKVTADEIRLFLDSSDTYDTRMQRDLCLGAEVFGFSHGDGWRKRCLKKTQQDR